MSTTHKTTRRRKHGQTKQELIDTAEIVFGRNGIEKTSVRMIVSELNANVSAINFHFGSFDELKREVLLRRTIPLVEERLSLLENARQADGSIGLHDIMSAWILPAARMATSPKLGERAFVRIMVRALFEAEPAYADLFSKQLKPHLDTFLAELGRALPELDRIRVFQRFNFILGAFGRAIVNEINLEEGDCPEYREKIDLVVGELIAFSAAGFAAEA